MDKNKIVKQLCSKNNYEEAAFEFINKPSVVVFGALVEKSEFLFDYVKQNIINRLQKNINQSNYKNLLSLLLVYSSDYENLIISNLIKYGDDKIYKIMKEKLREGTVEEKAYCISYFENTHADKEIIDIAVKLLSSDYDELIYNCSRFLGKMQHKPSLTKAKANLNSKDVFEVLKAVRFISAYGDKSSIPKLLEIMRTSGAAENIAVEILYMEDIFTLLENYRRDTLLLINHVINGLGEIIPINAIYDLKLYDLILELFKNPNTTLLHIKNKIDTLTENNEYLFDEEKEVKNEIFEIKKLLHTKSDDFWDDLCENIDLSDEYLLPFSLNIINELGLDYSEEILKILEKEDNQTAILKSVEVMKNLGKIDMLSKKDILKKVSDKYIKSIVKEIFDK